ncbi:hypothetical protein SBF1_9290002 [Candidatus Desulfosporosinus infrequens]|uniref:Uncharacterized protein n=1 Tax=Candidatus Desulfosporosinus infrequens TaxID=2043169 RepID=A0A2U3LXC7_9FIRM|nr:hypothetical protein SBF1_9290002 [Candidatus Desulfosporosinus infrequens]
MKYCEDVNCVSPDKSRLSGIIVIHYGETGRMMRESFAWGEGIRTYSEALNLAVEFMHHVDN